MRLKTYRANSMADALVQVKKDLGKDAVILHTRAYKIGTILGFGGKPQVEVTATVDINTIHPKRLREQAAQPKHAQPAREANNDQPSAIARAYSQAPAQSAQPSTRIDAIDLPPREPQPAANTAPVPDETLKAELAAIKHMVGQVLQQGPSGPAARMPQNLLDFYMKLLQADVARELADTIVADIRDDLSPAELADPAIVRQATLTRIEALLPPADATLPTSRQPDGRPLTIALIGPTGVGKTTTLAKLAAAYKLRHAQRVALVTCDTYRIAAVDQLRVYADIIGIPLKVVLTPAEMAAACEELAGYDCILIDSAGRSPSDDARLAELRAMLDAAKPHQTHLVLSSVVGQSALLRAADRFGALKPDHLIFTKLDEAASFGVLVEVSRRVKAKLAYVTTGQEVPDDIEPGRPDRLARLILDRSLTP